MTEPIKVGFLGFGIVGGGAAQILTEHADQISRRVGAQVDIGRVAVRSLTKPRAIELDPSIVTTDPWEVVGDPSIQIVVEAIGGIEPARDLILEAIKNNKHVVTANKELLATLGQDVMQAADNAGVDLLFEAAVGGGIPIIRPMKESLAGDHIRRVTGIVNGTTNFILTRMSETGGSFAEALEEAERLGYTELDPSADIEGFDAAQKLAILASIAFNCRVRAGDVHREGISKVTAGDIAAAHDLGYEVKLVAVAELDEGEVSARVHTAMLPRTHPLSAVRDVFNAVFIEGEKVGELMFLGRGAGGGPTGTAVVGDIIEIARNILTGGRSPGCTCYDEPRIRSQDQTHVRYYIVLSVLDQPGVLANVAGAFASHDVSIASVRQEGSGDQATLVLITHTATEGAHQATFADLHRLDVVKDIASTMRVEGAPENERASS